MTVDQIPERSILITGCSSGIGLCAAETMKARGWRVFATARKPEDIARLKDEVGVESLYLDYTEPVSIEAAAEQAWSDRHPLRRACDRGLPAKRRSQGGASHHRDIYKIRIARMEEGGKQTFKLGPEAVAAKLVHALESKRPKFSYYVTLPRHAVALLRRILPVGALDAVARRN